MRHFFVIIADQIDNTQRTQIHEVVKEFADSWWHEFLNTWVVEGGDSTTYWRDALRPIIFLETSLLILSLPGEGKGRAFALRSRAVEEKGRWFREEYLTSKPSSLPSSDSST